MPDGGADGQIGWMRHVAAPGPLDCKCKIGSPRPDGADVGVGSPSVVRRCVDGRRAEWMRRPGRLRDSCRGRMGITFIGMPLTKARKA